MGKQFLPEPKFSSNRSGNLIASQEEQHGPSSGAGLVFGSGIHRCLGAKLAELEPAVIVQETATALPLVQLHHHEPEWIHLLSFQAPRAVVVATTSR